LELVLVFWLVV
jgi:hypothetical protein